MRRDDFLNFYDRQEVEVQKERSRSIPAAWSSRLQSEILSTADYMPPSDKHIRIHTDSHPPADFPSVEREEDVSFQEWKQPQSNQAFLPPQLHLFRQDCWPRWMTHYILSNDCLFHSWHFVKLQQLTYPQGLSNDQLNLWAAAAEPHPRKTGRGRASRKQGKQTEVKNSNLILSWGKESSGSAPSLSHTRLKFGIDSWIIFS